MFNILKIALPGCLLLACLFLCPQLAQAAAPAAKTQAAKTLALADVEGSWLLNMEKSKSGVNTVASMLAEYKGFKFTISAKNKTMRMEWPGFDPKTHKLAVVKADSAKLECKLDGFEQIMVIEKIGPDELLIRDRDETLTFSRVKPAPKKK